VEPAVRAAAREALQAVLLGCPHLRPHLLASLAATLASAPEEAVGPLLNLLTLLRNTVAAWRAQLAEQQVGAPCSLLGCWGAGSAEALGVVGCWVC
jgi:hypothetical protein